MTEPSGTAWRAWSARNGKLYSPLALEFNKSHKLARAWPSYQRSECLFGKNHDGPECECGLRVVDTLPNLARFLLLTRRLRDQSPIANTLPSFYANLVIGKTDWYQPWQEPTAEDPQGTWRVGAVKIVGPLLVGKSLDASGLADSYGVEVQHSELDGEVWLSSYLGSDDRGYCLSCHEPLTEGWLCTDDIENCKYGLYSRIYFAQEPM